MVAGFIVWSVVRFIVCLVACDSSGLLLVLLFGWLLVFLFFDWLDVSVVWFAV